MLKKIYQKIRTTPWLLISLQLLLVLIIYMSVRSWQLRDAVSGPAPVIDAQLISGEPVNLNSYQGKPVLVHFWATWCPICEFENSSIAAIASDYQVITVASWSDGASAVQQYLQQQQLDMPVIIDEDGEWARLYGVRGVPASFIVDSQGMIRFTETGYSTETGLRLRLWWLEN